jgi:GAF domain-containing protein
MFGRAFGVLLRWRSPAGQATAWGVALITPPAIAAATQSFRGSLGLTGFLFCALLVVILVALIGGRRPALVAGVVGFLVGEYAFTVPYDTFAIHIRASDAPLLVFVVVGAAVAILVDQLARLLEEQTSLRGVESAVRRVATLVAHAASPEELFAAATKEIGGLFAVDVAGMGRFEADGTVTILAGWRSDGEQLPVGSRAAVEDGNLSAVVAATGRPARIDSPSEASRSVGALLLDAGVRSAVAVPITVQARLWGVMIAGSTAERPLPASTEAQLADLTELLATALANAESNAWLARLAEEQAALRRVATLVARGATPEEVFAAVADEVLRLLGTDSSIMGRYESDGTLVSLARSGGPDEHLPVGTRHALGGNNLGTIVFETGRPARVDNYTESASGPLGAAAREMTIRSSVGTPIVVEGRLWGLIAAGSTQDAPLPADAEARLGSFTELLATAVANAESRAGLAQLADEQDALRRVATLVAGGRPPEEVFAAVTEEVERLFGSDGAALARFEADGTFTILASAGELFSVGSRWPIGGNNVATTIFETSRPARIDNLVATGPLADQIREAGVRSSVGTPIIVEGHLWGVAGVVSIREAMPADTEARLAGFTELVATAIANADSRGNLARLADEQAALRRVATLVARGVPPEEVFASVTEEAERLFLCDVANLTRFESDRTFTILASQHERFPVGSRWPIGGKNVTTVVFETGRPARIDDFFYTGPLADDIRGEIRSAVGSPILVEERLWGAIGLGSFGEHRLPADTEERLMAFTELVAMAIANAQSRAALRPVERMRSQAERITERQLSERLPVSDDPGEVTALGQTLNAMLDRVEEAVARERRVVSDASHELRTPLTTLRAEVDLALIGDRDKSELRAALESASEEAKRMSRLADDLLVLARADQGRLPLHRQPLAARELLEDAAVRAHAGVEVRGRSIAVAELSDGCTVRADPDRAAQALDNLITNALLHGDGTITLSAQSKLGYVEIHVSDQGPGFPDDLLPRAFERFGRGQHARANEPGSGLGLALVEAVARAHGGYAGACNRPDGGADVSFTLPQA